MSARCKHPKYSLHIDSVMEFYYLLYLFVLTDFAAEALLRVEREAKCPQITNFSGRVKYRRRGTRANFRCLKKFDRYGPKFATCQDDGTWSNEPPLCTKTGCLPLDQNLVSNLIMDVVNQAVVKFSCDQNYHLLGETLAYCDGKDWSAPLPRCLAPHELTECDFEEDLCGWTQDDSDEQDWIRTLGPTPTGNTGPKYDHTYGDKGNGHYLFFETSNPTMTGHQAILSSPIYNEHLSPMCFDFWYHILGPDEAGHVGSLEVFVLDQSQFIDDDNIQPLFVKEGNQGDKWQRGDIFIDSQVESYQIVIVATRALSYISDIAIDDVRLYNCPRKHQTGQTSTVKQTSTTLTSTPTPTQRPSTTESTKIATQTTQTIKSTTISSTKTTLVTETSTQSPTTITYKKTNTTLKPTIKTTAQSSSTSQVSVSTKALPSTAKSSTNSLSTKISTQTPQTTKPDTTTTPITTPSQEHSTITMSTAEATGKSSAKTTLKSTSTSTQKTKLPSSTVKSTTTSTLSASTTSSKTTTTSRPSTSTTTPSATTSVKTFSTSSVEKTPSTIKTSTSQTESPRKISSTTTTPMLKSTRLSSSTSPSSTSITTRIDLSTKSQSSTVHMNDITGKENAITKSQNTIAGNTQTSTTTLGTTKVSKPTKRTNALTTKSSVASNTTKDNSISVTNERSQHPEDETLKPLLIGLCVGIVAGLIIIGVIAYVCVRRRKFYTSRYEDELKPITNSASVQSLNNGHYYQDEEYESES